MKHAWPVAMIAVVLAFAPTSCSAQLLRFTYHLTSHNDVQLASVYGRGQVLLRLRAAGGGDVARRAQDICERLTQAALAGAKPQDVSVIRRGRSAQVKVGSVTVVTADDETARLANTTPAALARSWARNLAAAFAEPYLAVSVGGELRVPVGERRGLSWGGTVSGPVAAVSSDPSLLSCAVQPGQRKVWVQGQAPGSAYVNLTVGSASCRIPVAVKYWAAHMPRQVTCKMSGRNVPQEIEEQAVLNAVLAHTKSRPGAVIQVRRLGRSGEQWSAVLVAQGKGYLPVKQEVAVKTEWAAAPQRPIATTIISNAPETAAGPGLLLREPLPSGRGVRLLWHHRNGSTRPLRLVCRIANPTTQPARVHLFAAHAGPGSDEIYVGHVAVRQFWIQWDAGWGYVADIPPASAWNFYQREFLPQQVLSGIAQLLVLSAEGLVVETMIEEAAVMPQFMEAVSGDMAARHDLFSFPAAKLLELHHTCGSAWTFHHIGKAPSRNEHDVELAGDYGVLQDIRIELTNPRSQPAAVELAVQASGGAARAIFKVEGLTKESGLLRPNEEWVLERVTVPAGRSRTVRVLTIPQAGSNYPLTLIVRTIN